MQTLIQFGISFIVALQSAGTWLTFPMRLFSYLGTEDFFFLVLPMVYWCVDSALGLRIGFILVTSSMLNYVGKLIFAGPRPYWVSSHVKALWMETTFGIPSGHAQHAVAVWGMIAAYFRRTWMWVTGILLIFLIGFSRLYLGSHFPHDVVAGWLIGIILLVIFVRFWGPVEVWIAGKTFPRQVLIAFLVSLIFIAAGLGSVSLRRGFQLPDAWVNNTLLAGTELPAPVDVNGTFTSAGTFFGLAVGAAWIASLGGYQAGGPIEKRVLRYAVGLVGILILWMGLGAVLPRGDGFIFYALRFIRYSLVGWWVAGGAPWVFFRFRLAMHENAGTPSI